MNMLRRAQDGFVAGRERAVAELRQAKVVSSDETGVRIEGSNAYHWVFRCDQAVVHQAAPTRGAVVIRTMMDGHRPEVWCSDRYAAQQGHAPAHQTCLAHLARDVAYALDLSQDDLAFLLQLWLQKTFALARDITTFAALSEADASLAKPWRRSELETARAQPVQEHAPSKLTGTRVSADRGSLERKAGPARHSDGPSQTSIGAAKAGRQTPPPPASWPYPTLGVARLEPSYSMARNGRLLSGRFQVALQNS